MKSRILAFIAATALMGASGTAQAETWECAIFGATQQADRANPGTFKEAPLTQTALRGQQ